LYNKAKKSGKETDWSKFKTAKKQLSKNLKSARDTYLSGYLTDTMQENPKAFWSYIKRLRQDNPGVEDFKMDNELISDAGLKSEVLSKQFASVFTTENVENIPTPGSNFTLAIGNIVITVKGVEKQLASLDAKKASGPDGIPPWFLKEKASQIAPILTDIYQESISSGSLPGKWKEANVCAVFKKGKKCDPGNYRSISLTCIASKVLEHIVHSHLMKHLERHRILIDNQHGFRAKRSTETQLICTTHDITNAIQQNKQANLAILDFSKAFDKVPHQRLLTKLEYYGIRDPLQEWFKSFLIDRSQVVVCDGATSTPITVTSGVPQSTVLGPVLFLLYINDLAEELKSTVRLFADDALLYCFIESDVDADSLQADLCKLEEWQDRWQMEFNSTKCKVMCITTKKNIIKKQYMFCGQILEEVEDHPYLGVMFDNKMKWSSHISNTTRKANVVLHVIKRNLWNCPRDVKEVAYKSLVRPTLEYASTAWDPYYKKDVAAVERVQRSAARFCLKNYDRTASVSAMLKELDWDTLETRRKRTRLCMMYKLSRGLLNLNTENVLVPSQETRTRNSHTFKYRVPRATKDIFKYSFYPRTLTEWNSLPKELVLSETLDTFQSLNHRA
ncbi:Hypothetical predicted protein, partial [Paramuricea clavata]